MPHHRRRARSSTPRPSRVWEVLARLQRPRPLASGGRDQRDRARPERPTRSAACAGSGSRTARNCASNCWRCRTSSRASAIACSTRRSRMFNYVAHVRLLPVTDGDRTFWHWESRFTTRPEERSALARHGRRRHLSGRVRGDAQTLARGRMRREVVNAGQREDLRDARRGGGGARVATEARASSAAARSSCARSTRAMSASPRWCACRTARWRKSGHAARASRSAPG